MNLSRRGFLGTMLAAAAGAAASFDPVRKLWVMAQPAEIVVPAVTWTSAVADETADLTDVALRFARSMGEQLQSHHATVLRDVAIRHTGHAGLGQLLLDGQQGGEGYFAPSPTRIQRTLQRGSREPLDDAARAMSPRYYNVDMFAPIGTELRQGVPFTDCLVGTATDAETGLSARALRFKTTDGTVHTMVEVSGGRWHGSGGRARRRSAGQGERTRILLSEALLVGSTPEEQERTRIEEMDGSVSLIDSMTAAGETT